MATNGDITLAVWADERSGTLTTYAARISRDAIALDPLGIPLAVGAQPETAVWNGEAFLVVVAYEQSRELLFVSPDGRVMDRKPLAISNSFRFAASLSPGANVRLLYVGPSELVMDGHGDLSEGDKTPLPNAWTATGSDSEFLLVGYGYPIPAASYRFSADGKLLSIADSKLPVDSIDGSEAVASGDGGFLLIKQTWLDPKVIAYRLDSNGVFVDKTLLADADPSDRKIYTYHPCVIRAGDRWLVSWDSSLLTGRSYVYASAVTFDGQAEPPHTLQGWDGITFGTVLVSGAGFHNILIAVDRLFTSSNVDLFAQTLSDTLEPGPLQGTTASATLQTNAAIAQSNSGYAVMWSETGPDRYSRLNIRRFSDDGTPLDPQPVELMRRDQDFTGPPLPFGQIISNGETYLFTWQDAGEWRGRRMSSRTGEWLDPAAFPMDFPEAALASNGVDVLAVWARGSTLSARRIAMSGEPLASAAVTVSSSGAPYSVTVASNGTDYLAAWSDGYRDCSTLCVPPPPFNLLAARLHADGTPIDGEPITLEQENSYPDSPSIAWNGGRYLAVWSDGLEVRGAFVTTDGTVSGRATLQRDEPYSSLPKVLPLASGFALVTETHDYTEAIMRPVLWQAVTFSANVNLSEVSGMPRSALVRFDNDHYDSFAVDARGSRLLAAYNVSGDRALGNVARVVSRPFAPPAPRSRAVRR